MAGRGAPVREVPAHRDVWQVCIVASMHHGMRGGLPDEAPPTFAALRPVIPPRVPTAPAVRRVSVKSVPAASFVVDKQYTGEPHPPVQDNGVTLAFWDDKKSCAVLPDPRRTSSTPIASVGIAAGNGVVVPAVKKPGLPLGACAMAVAVFVIDSVVARVVSTPPELGSVNRVNADAIHRISATEAVRLQFLRFLCNLDRILS